MTMDLRYYNEETGQWEVMFANATDLSSLAGNISSLSTTTNNHIANTNVHLQAGERDKINNALGFKSVIANSDINNILTPGIYIVGNGNVNSPGLWGILTVKTIDNVTVQMYNDHYGYVSCRGMYVDGVTGQMWTKWNRVLTEDLTSDISKPGALVKMNSIGNISESMIPIQIRNMASRHTDGSGPGIFTLFNNGPATLIGMAFVKQDPSRYIFMIGYKSKPLGLHYLKVISNNGLELGAYNDQGTQVLNGAPFNEVLFTSIIIGGVE